METGHYKTEENNSVMPGKQYFADKHKRILMTIFPTAIIIAIMWIWSTVQIRTIRKKYELQRTELVQRSNREIVERSRYFLKLVARSYAWSAKAELMHRNGEQTPLYSEKIIGRKGFISAMIANKNGKIISSTDKSFLNGDFVSISHPFYLTVDSTIVNMLSDSLWVVASPVMDGKKRLGTVIINYNYSLGRSDVQGSKRVL